MNDRLILMGIIGKAHGVRGLVRVNTFTEDPAALAEYPLTDRAGRQFTLEWQHDNVAQLYEGKRPITDRTEAERLTNLELFAPRSALPEPEEDEFYLTDLIGLQATSESGSPLGTITAIHDYGAGASLEISPGARLIPFTKSAVPAINLATGSVTINPPTEITLKGAEK